MVKTRSSAISPRAPSSSPQKRSCSSSSSSSSAARRKSRRRRTVAMPDRKRKMRRQMALQKQAIIANASQEVVTEELHAINTKSVRNSGSKQLSPFSTLSGDHSHYSKAVCRKLTKSSFKIDKRSTPSCNRGHKTSKQKAVLTIVKERNPDSTKGCRKSNRIREMENQNALFHAICKKVKTPEKADDCSREFGCDPVTEMNHANEWTSEQDLTLQNAYLQVRPSSNFWFEVSKKVPGKSANECFDRFYSAHPTPCTTQPRSRKLAVESPVRTISFPSPMPSFNCKVRFGRGKHGLLKAHQTVRHILRQQKIADKTYEADIFTAVEQFNSRNPLLQLQDCTNRAISPLPALKGKDTSSGSLAGTPSSCFGAAKSESQLWLSVSSKQKPQSGHEENMYTNKSTIKSKLSSPEVLKTENNPGRLDRFLDILLLRRAEKRKIGTAKRVSQDNEGEPTTQKTFKQCVAAAREALISDTRDVLKAVCQQNSTVAEEETSTLSDNLEEESLLLLED